MSALCWSDMTSTMFGLVLLTCRSLPRGPPVLHQAAVSTPILA
jgi:hypothetical protein